MAELTLVEAINDGFHVELERDPDVMVMGEDVGRAGGVFRATAGLRDRFGPERCVDTPLAEAGILGSAVGLCMAGWRPVYVGRSCAGAGLCRLVAIRSGGVVAYGTAC